MITLRELRKRRTPYNQKEMALRLGVGEAAYSLYETGKRRPSYEVLVRMSCVLGVDVQVLLNIFLPYKSTKRKEASS